MPTCKECNEVVGAFDFKNGVCRNCLGEEKWNASVSNEIEATESHDDITSAKQEVVITDIKMPFLSMVVFMIKWAIASIPAMFILTVIFTIILGIIDAMISVPAGY